MKMRSVLVFQSRPNGMSPMDCRHELHFSKTRCSIFMAVMPNFALIVSGALLQAAQPIRNLTTRRRQLRSSDRASLNVGADYPFIVHNRRQKFTHDAL